MTSSSPSISQPNDGTAVSSTSKGSPTSASAKNPLTRRLESPPLGAQMDVAVLDDYLHSLLLAKFLQSLDPLLQTLSGSGSGSGSSNNNEHNHYDTIRTIRMVLSSCLTAATLWMTHLQTPATKMLGLQTVITTTNNNNNSGGGGAAVSVWATKWKYVIVSAVLPLCYQALQRVVVEMQHQDQHIHDDNGEANHQTQRQIARRRQYQLARRMVQSVQQGIPLFKLGLLLSLLFQPKTNSKERSATAPSMLLAPRLSMALSGLTFITATASSSSSAAVEPSTSATSPPTETTTAATPATSMTPSVAQPGFYVLYAHRRWLYEESMQTFRLVFGPLVASLQDGRELVEDCMSRLVGLLVPRILMAPSSTARNLCSIASATASVDQSCSLCAKYPITIPYETDVCEHIFCYACLWKATSNKGRNDNLRLSPPTITSRQHQQKREGETTPQEPTHGTGYLCPTCHQRIRNTRPVTFQRYHRQQPPQASDDQQQQKE